jgi:hypothetical protein
MVLPAAIPITAALAETPAAAPSQADQRSLEMRARLLDGRMAMIRESLKLNEAQLKLWAPVEAELRSGYAARQKARAERHARWQAQDHERKPLPDRLDAASERAAARAQHVKMLADAFRPFYASLSDEQKAVAAVVLRPAWGRGRGFHGRRWSQRQDPAPEQR